MSIEAIGFAVPSIRQSAADVAAATAADPTFVSNKVGLAERYILGDEESGISLATSACTALLGQPGLAGLSPDLLVCITQNPDRRIPHNSPGIAAALGLPTTIASFDISLACSGYVYGVQIVEGFLQQCGMRHAILVTCDPYSRIMAQEDKDTNCIFGDAATAT
jgi:3-oxoacyl-[acyl-carrier-protein] synthase III